MRQTVGQDSVGQDSVGQSIKKMDVTYQLYVSEVHVADLCDPKGLDDRWCEYRVVGKCLDSEDMLRNSEFWEEADYRVLDLNGNESRTFVGQVDLFCASLDDRLAFKSLFPPDLTSREVETGLLCWLKWLFPVHMFMQFKVR